MDLPQELLDAIFDELVYDGDPKFLGACSLSCWSLLMTARRYRFRCVSITQGRMESHGYVLGNPSRECARFLDLVQILEQDPCHLPPRKGHPTLSSCIRHLSLQLSSAFQGDFDRSPFVPSAQKHWVAMNKKLPYIFSRLTRLQSVTLHFLSTRPFSWHLLDPPIISSLLQLLRSPSINTLDLSHIHGLPANIVLHCPNLKDLRVRGLVQEQSVISTYPISASQTMMPNLTYPPPSLESLTLASSDHFCSVLTNILKSGDALPFKTLRALHLPDARSQPFNAETQVAVAASSTLQYLEISFIQCVYLSGANIFPILTLTSISRSFIEWHSLWIL